MSSVYCVVYRTTRVRIRLKIGVQCYARACLMSMRTVWEDSFSHVRHLEESAREIFSLLTTASSRTPGLWLKKNFRLLPILQWKWQQNVRPYGLFGTGRSFWIQVPDLNRASQHFTGEKNRMRKQMAMYSIPSNLGTVFGRVGKDIERSNGSVQKPSAKIRTFALACEL